MDRKANMTYTEIKKNVSPISMSMHAYAKPGVC